MGTCKGKLSEGLDFSDDAARCVIIVGVPFPQVSEPRIILKKHHLSEREWQLGEKWYKQ